MKFYGYFDEVEMTVYQTADQRFIHMYQKGAWGAVSFVCLLSLATLWGENTGMVTSGWFKSFLILFVKRKEKKINAIY